ncbi:Peptidase S9, prolyl oligopeptidase, catalytic domain [Dillenia turbinata]|uniref:Peptidase S9, prolyl oligopeptidase, catalytic domain n=1 Tax=Dillenia turbinata TaxID=194707 RepID=A0AAN8WDX7_9MAGN
MEDNEKKKKSAPYGSWKSPITSDMVSGSDKRLEGFSIGPGNRLLWLETRPSDSGRCVVVREPEKNGDEPVDVTPKEFSVMSRVNEYGGGAFCVSGNVIVFSNFGDQRLYRQSIESLDYRPKPITLDYGGPVVRYADGVFDPRFNRLVVVREDHRGTSAHPTAEIVSVDFDEEDIKEPEVLIGGNDFYAFPRVDQKGERLAWIEWSHPNMHWDRAELWVGYVSEKGEVYKRTCVAGGDPAVIESPTEPKWSAKGELYFVSDRNTGFWNIYKWIEQKNEVFPVCSLNAEFTRPLWNLGISSYDFILSNDQSNLLVCSYRQNGISHLGTIDEERSSFSVVSVPFTDIKNIISGGSKLYIEGASANDPLSLAKLALEDDKIKADEFKIIWSSSSDHKMCLSYFSVPELIEFPTEVAGLSAYAYFYPPWNPLYQGSPEEKPPLLLESHGGPTEEARGTLNLKIQYWTSRGWAYVDVNYGGSTGFGREFRERLLKSWGVVDVGDCCSCTKFLVDRGKVDGERLCITGCSAGGYTTLASLAFRETFKAGASLFGIADLTSLRAEMHKFEAHYITNLVGSNDAFFERSPINHVDKFSCPIILFQGLEDKVVHPEQACKIYSALKQKSLPVALVEYEGEPHGFRKAENIKFTLEQQMLFFARTVGHFEVADDIKPIRIENFD